MMKANTYKLENACFPHPEYDLVTKVAVVNSKTFGTAILIVLVTVVAYLPALRAGFVWDDDILLTQNPIIHAQEGWWRLWVPGTMLEYYPLTWLSFWLEWRLWGENPTGYHAVNILLHAIGAVLIWRVLRRLQVRGAWLAALLFAVHPVTVESVAWVSERKNTLSLVFYALTMLAYLRFEHESKSRWYWAATGSFLLALLSKPSGVTLPAVLLLCAWWQRGKLQRRDLLRSIPFFALAMVFGLLTISSQQMQISPDVAAKGTHRPFWFRVGAAGHVFWFYLWKALLPIRLMTEYPLWDFRMLNVWFWLPTSLVGLALAATWWFRNKWGRPVLFALLYFGLMLFPVSGLFNMPYVGRSPVVADHLQYLALIGIAALAAAAITSLPANAAKIAACGLVAALGHLTWLRAAAYENHERLFGDTLAKNPNATKAHLEIGNAYVRRGQLEAAAVHFREALRLKPWFVEARCNLANILAQLGRAEEAIPHFAEAIRRRPKTAELYHNLGLALLSLNRLDEAIPQFERALELKPNLSSARTSLAATHYNYALKLAREGQTEKAIFHFNKSIELAPSNALAHNNLGVLLAQQGKLAEARKHFAEAVRLAPHDPDYRRNLEQSLKQSPENTSPRLTN